jgi:hypothetical protein
VQIVLACFSGAVTIVAFFVSKSEDHFDNLSRVLYLILLLVPETYAPTILRHRAARLSRVTGQIYKAPMDIGSKLDFAWFRTQLQRPWQLLFQEPIVMIISVYMAIVYVSKRASRFRSWLTHLLQGTLYLLFAAFPIVSPGVMSRL